MPDDLEFRIAKLSLGPKDVLVVKYHGWLTEETRTRFQAMVRRQLPRGRKVLIIDRVVDLLTLTKAEIEARAAP